jgi:hypothetical protein
MQDLTVDGDSYLRGELTVNSWTWLRRRLVFPSAAYGGLGPTMWMIENQPGQGKLVIYPNWNWSSPAQVLYSTGEAAFPHRVSIGNVACIQNAAGNDCVRADMGTLTLAVGGKLGARSVHVVAPAIPWPDYVFAPAYALRPLPAVEAFIQANGHLPEVPSAAEVARQGLDLGAMDALLLKKIEELTLHLIALEKQNAALQQRVQQLEIH